MAMWQTPVSKVSPKKATPLDSSSARAASTSATRSGNGLPVWATNSIPTCSGCQTPKHVLPAHCS